jgi:hypothetical protein
MRDEPSTPVRQQAAAGPAVVYGRAGADDFVAAAGPTVDRSGPAVAVDPSAPPAGAAMEPLDIRALLHPAEHSRLLLALSSSAVVFGFAAMVVYASQGWTALAEYAGYLAAFGALVWMSLQVARSRLLGGAVRVSQATLPQLQSVFDEVRARLDYQKHVDVYVMDKVSGGSAMTSYLGTRLIQLEGGLAAELLDEGRHAELTYLIGRHLGQLKARHQRLQPIFLAISLIDSLKFLQLFLAPYLRATVKSGDQIAAACCGDIRATAGTMNRLLVGKELGPKLVIKGVLDQAAIVRRRWLPRLAQLFMSEPHATNRYLNLLAFFARVAPEEISAWRASLDQPTADRLTAVLDTSSNRRPPRRHASPVSMLLATLVTGGLLALSGWLIFGGPGPAAGSTGGANRPTAGPATAEPTPSGNRAARASQRLLARVPAGFAATCTPIHVTAADASHGADAEVVCQPKAAGVPGDIFYQHYRASGQLQNVYSGLTRGLSSGDCTSSSGQTTYSVGSPPQPGGDLACFVSNAGQRVFVWTDSRLHILGVAASDSMTFANLYQWWSRDSGPEPTTLGSKVARPQPLSGINTTMSTYFDAINSRNYRLAWSQLSPADQAVNPYTQFAAGDSTTTIANWTLHGIASGPRPGTYIAFVTFQSYQNPSEAPNHSDSCDVWTLNYTMIQTSDRWLIDEAAPHPGVPEYQRCG